MADTGMSPYVNPFNAGFGVDPPHVAGRDPLIHRILADLRDGPGRASYVKLILGDRGVGKTVLLNQIREHVTTEFQWAVFRWTAKPTGSFADDLDDAYDRLLDGLAGRPIGRVRSGSVGVSGGVVKAQLDVGSARRPRTVTGQLRSLADVAVAHRTVLVLLVDELQAGSTADLSTLSTAIQETNSERLPIALVAAGLPGTRGRLKSATGATFIERQRAIMVGNLEPDAAREALERPLIDNDRQYDPAIFNTLIPAAGGYPYAIQLVGEHMWNAAAGESVIRPEHALAGATRARDDLDTIYEARWSQLTERQRAYMAVVIDQLDADGTALSSVVAATLGGGTSDHSRIRHALVSTHQLLCSDATNKLRPALPGLDEWIRRTVIEAAAEAP